MTDFGRVFDSNGEFRPSFRDVTFDQVFVELQGGKAIRFAVGIKRGDAARYLKSIAVKADNYWFSQLQCIDEEIRLQGLATKSTGSDDDAERLEAMKLVKQLCTLVMKELHGKLWDQVHAIEKYEANRVRASDSEKGKP